MKNTIQRKNKETIMRTITLMICLLLSTLVSADNKGSEETALKLLEVLNVEKAIKVQQESMLKAHLEQSPEIKAYEPVIKTFLEKHITFVKMKPQLIHLYTSFYTEQELNDLIVFYKSSVGQKTLTTEPRIQQVMSKFGQNLVFKNLSELSNMVSQEVDRQKTQVQFK